MNQGRGTTIEHLSSRPKGGSFEPKRDCFGRDSFCMPEVRSLAALSLTPEDEHSQTYRIRLKNRSSMGSEKGMLT